MTTMQLNSHVRQFEGFAPRRRIFGRAPEIPTEAIGNPHFEDYTKPREAPTAKTHQILGVIQEIRQASINADFDNKLNMALHRRLRETKSAEFFLRRSIFC